MIPIAVNVSMPTNQNKKILTKRARDRLIPELSPLTLHVSGYKEPIQTSCQKLRILCSSFVRHEYQIVASQTIGKLLVAFCSSAHALTLNLFRMNLPIRTREGRVATQQSASHVSGLTQKSCEERSSQGNSSGTLQDDTPAISAQIEICPLALREVTNEIIFSVKCRRESGVSVRKSLVLPIFYQ